MPTDLATDARFPRYGPAAKSGGSAPRRLSLFQVHVARCPHLYGRRGALQDLVSLGPLLAHQATMTVGYAIEDDAS